MENGCFKNIHSRRLFLAIFLGCERILIESKDYDWNISYLNIYLLFFFFICTSNESIGLENRVSNNEIQS
jgi:hypothetical protein